MIRKALISSIYEAASIQRWNDHIRPSVGFSELDKQAHKMVYAYTLAACEGEGNYNPLLLIEASIFEFFQRGVLTDIKPPIYHSLMKNKGEQINKWILEQLKGKCEGIGGGFYDKMTRYFTDKDYAKKERAILRAAHYWATDWEFKVIYPMNGQTYAIEEVKAEVEKGLLECNTFQGFEKFSKDANLKKFMSLMGKLRYQQRWSRAVRMPETSVLGHMAVVAMLSYFCSVERSCSDKRVVNNYFAGLFHDMPEVLTRDIVSPVKSSVAGLDNLIKQIEDEQMRKVIYPLVTDEIREELDYYTQDEFLSKIKIDGRIVTVTSDEIFEKYNSDKYSPVDGEIIRACDHLSAYLEAYLSIKCGINSEQLEAGYHSLFERYENRIIAGIDFGQMFDYFRM